MEDKQAYEARLADIKARFEEELRSLASNPPKHKGGVNNPHVSSKASQHGTGQTVHHASNKKQRNPPAEQTNDSRNNNHTIPHEQAVTQVEHTSDDEGPDSKMDGVTFRRDLNRRMGIPEGGGKVADRIKRERRQFVLIECLKRGMDLKQNFNSYSYESKMYSAIKSISDIVPPTWGWDRSVTKDVIRTLCWDRVRSKNRRERLENPSLADKAAEKPNTSRKRQQHSKTSTSLSEDIVRESSMDPDSDSQMYTPSKPPKTVSRTPIPVVFATNERSRQIFERSRQIPERSHQISESPSSPRTHPETISGEISLASSNTLLANSVSAPVDKSFTKKQKACTPRKDTGTPRKYTPTPRKDILTPVKDIPTLRKDIPTSQVNKDIPTPRTNKPTPSVDTSISSHVFRVVVGRKSFRFQETTKYEEFDNFIGGVLPVKSDEVRLYRALSGDKQDKSWKTLNWPEEYKKMMEKYSTIGVQLKTQSSATYYCSGSEPDSSEFELPEDYVKKPSPAKTLQQNNWRDLDLPVERSRNISAIRSSPERNCSSVTMAGNSKRQQDLIIGTDIAEPNPKRPKATKSAPSATRKPIRRKVTRSNSDLIQSKETATKKQRNVKKGLAEPDSAEDEPKEKKVKRPVGRPPSKKTLALRAAKAAAEAEAEAAKKAETLLHSGREMPRQDETEKEESYDGRAENHDDHDTDMAESQEFMSRRSSSRSLGKSRINRDQKEYQQKVIEANKLKRAREKLKQEWTEFEANNPPAYVRN